MHANTLLKALLLTITLLPTSGLADAPADRRMRIPLAPMNGEGWQAGIHYNVLMMDSPKNTRVEILELSMYTSFFGTEDGVATQRFRTQLKAWLQSSSDKFHFVRKPSVAGTPHARIMGSMFFALEMMGRSDLQEAMDAWVTEPRHEPAYHNIMHPDEREIEYWNLQFLRAHGVDTKTWKNAIVSEYVKNQVSNIEAMTGMFAIQGTPTFVINRHFSTSAQRLAYPNEVRDSDLQRLLKLIQYLANSELAEADLRASPSAALMK